MTQPNSNAVRWRLMRSRFQRIYGTSGQLVDILKVWEPEPGFPDFETPAQAKRAYMQAMDPAFTAAIDDERMAEHWKRWQRNVNSIKLVRAKGLS